MSHPPPRETPAAEIVERALERGDRAAALAALTPMLEARGRAGDAVSLLALRVMALEAEGPFTPDAMAATVDRLVALVREQEAQIVALRTLVETQL